MKLFMIAKSNIKRSKNITFTLIALIVFSTVLLYIGTSVLLDINTFLDEKNSELNGSDFIAISPRIYEETAQEVVKEMGDYQQLETEDVIVISSTEFKNNNVDDKSQTIGCLFLNADVNRDLSKLVIIDEGEYKYANSIIVPYFLKISKGYQTGDDITIAYGGETNTYVIYGFAEDIMFATPSNITIYKCYLFEDDFRKLYSEVSDNAHALLIKTKLVEGTNFDDYEADFVNRVNDLIGNTTLTIMAANYDTMKVGVSIFLVIIMAILIVFSLIIIIIALIVMRFAIVTHIEGNIKNIGSMEAMGYTGKQLIFATVLQFVLITVIGCGIGFIIAFSIAGVVTNIVSSSIGLSWNSEINIVAILISLVSIMTLVIMIAYLASAKIKKITPIIALRNGIETHNFRKNHFPLRKSILPLNVALGLKSFAKNMKQNITILIIVILMSFVCVFAFSVNYNFNVDNTAFIRLIGLEKSHLSVRYYGENAIEEFDEIERMEQVEKTVRITNINLSLTIGDRELSPAVMICNDYNLLETSTIVRGRYPIHDNEIAVTGVVLKHLNAELGDVLTVKGTEEKQDFIIVGATQQISMLGKGASITEEGMKRLNSSFVPSVLHIYLNNTEAISEVNNTLVEKYGDKVSVNNVEESFDTILASFNSAVILLCIVCILITLSIITLILYLLIKIRLLKERTRIGLAKALGYTTKQLVLQIIISFCPVTIFGALIGTVMAMYLVNPLFAASLSIAGILNSNLIINPMLTVITFIAISIYSIIITALVAMRIRKITPCELFV